MPGSSKSRIVLALTALAILLFGITPATAQRALVGVPLALCLAPEHTGDRAVAMLRATARFDCTTPQIAFGSGNYWVRSAPLSVRGEVALRSGSVWQDRAEIRALYADGVILTHAMDGRGASRAIQLGATFEHRFPARASPIVRFLWRIEGAANQRGIVARARVATPEESAQANLLLAACYAAFGGLCLALMVYNLALWGAMRHDFQLVYCGMLVILAGYAFSSSGALAWVWPGIENNDRMRINYVLLAATASVALAFARRFFEPHIFTAGLRRFIIFAGGAAITGALAYAAFADRSPVVLGRIYTGSFVFVPLSAVAILIAAWRRRSNFLWIFAICWGAPIVFAATRMVADLNLIPSTFLLDNSTLIAMTMEALLSSLAIAYRIRILSRERDIAREQEIAARMLADADPLTGLLNRRAFLREAIGRPGLQQLTIIDLDHFKAVNETLGHDGGDEVLRRIARVLREAVPDDALVARIGGEEFAIVTDATAPVMANDLLARVRAHRMPFDLTVTTSLGSCTGTLASEVDWKALYRSADQALFRAKDAGRDRARSDERAVLAA